MDNSPDGRWIVFDMLGQIYRVPAVGGEAESLTADSGVALNFDPRYSPDGDLIAFISDRSGQNSLWVMDQDGENPRLIAEGGRSWIVEPSWAADGQSIFAVRRYIPSYAPGGWTISTKLWRFPLSGGSATELEGGDRAYLSTPSPSPDGRYLYYAIEDEPGIVDGYFLVGDRHHIRRLDLVSGDDQAITQPMARRAYWQTPFYSTAPEVSPDGTLLAFARRVPFESTEFRGRAYNYSTGLWLRDLGSGQERLLVSPITPDHFETFNGYHQRFVPGYSWTADGESIHFTEGGKIRRVNVLSGEVSTTPFNAKVHREISELIRPQFRIEGNGFRSRFLMRPATNAKLNVTAFDAIGRIWTVDGDGTEPGPLTGENGSEAWEFSLAWSPDGRFGAYVTWEDGRGGHLWKIAASGGAPIRLSNAAAEYLNPAWSTDGRKIVVVRGTGAALRGQAVNDNQSFELVRFDALKEASSGTVLTAIQPMYPIVRPHFGPGERIYFLQETAESDGPGIAAGNGRYTPTRTLVSVTIDGEDRRPHATFTAAEDAAISPDGRYVAWREAKNLHLGKPGASGKALFQSGKGQGEARQLTRSGGLHPRWIDANTLEFVNGNVLYQFDVPSGQTSRRQVDLNVARRQSTEALALVGARIITMREQDGIVEEGDVVIENGRIACVGKCSHDGTVKTIEVRGKTIIPGLFDAHCHPEWDRDVFRQRNPSVAIYLAYGVTTCFEPANTELDVFPAAELIAAGRMVGPRILGTGPIVFPDIDSLPVKSLVDAGHVVEALATWGAVSVKQYTLPRRDQRQWLAHAIRTNGRLGMTGEGLDLYYDLGMVMDGQTGFEHPITTLPIYRDVAEFLGQAGANNTPAFQASGQGLYASEYWRTRVDVFGSEKYRRWTPWWKVGRFANYNRRPIGDYPIPLWAEGVKDLLDAGASVSVGAHNREDGIGPHWEIWTFATALEPMRALSAATIYPARYLGFERDLGSVEVGKIADLVVLNADPLTDIQATADIAYVVANGILYDDETLDQLWPEARPYGPRPWATFNQEPANQRSAPAESAGR